FYLARPFRRLTDFFRHKDPRHHQRSGIRLPEETLRCYRAHLPLRFFAMARHLFDDLLMSVTSRSLKIAPQARESHELEVGTPAIISTLFQPCKERLRSLEFALYIECQILT